MKRRLLIITLIGVLIIPGLAVAGNPGGTLDPSLRKDIDQSIRKGLMYLKNRQEDNGSWQHYPAITGLAISTFLRSGFGFMSQDTFINKGFSFLLQARQKDGGIYIDDLANYNTAIVLSTFKDAKDIVYQDVILGMESFLMGIQFDETNGYTKDSLYYGGTGYGFKERPDLSNVQWSLEALFQDMKQEVEVTRDPKKKKLLEEKIQYMDRALVFLAKCQNHKATNPEAYAGNDGGFMYGPGISKAGDQLSYGSMTYAGLKSMIHARLNKTDPRVQAAYGWLQQSYSVDENPGLGAQGLFYYYQTMAKCLQAYGEGTLTDKQGRKHAWKEDLASKLIALQNPDGSWINTGHSRWMEDNPVLVSCYALLALEEICKE